MTAIHEFILRSFELDSVAWMLLCVIAAPMLYMLFATVENWGFRLMAVPTMLLSAGVVNTAMSDFALHVTTDKIVNQGIGFGAGLFAAMLILSLISWVWYEFFTYR